MDNKNLIIQLIQQDLKHNQLLSGLEAIGLESYHIHSLQIIDVVSKLMQVSASIIDDWDETYLELMQQASLYQITARGETLKPLAEVCYQQLKAMMDTGI